MGDLIAVVQSFQQSVLELSPVIAVVPSAVESDSEDFDDHLMMVRPSFLLAAESCASSPVVSPSTSPSLPS